MKEETGPLLPPSTWRERVQRLHLGLEHALGLPLVRVLLLAILALVYTDAYLNDPLLPALPPEAREGWWSWSDQWAYARSAADLAAGWVTAEHYLYPLGYPALGALGWAWSPTHAFFPANLLLVLLIGWATWRLWRRWLSRTACLVLAAVFMWAHVDLLTLTLVIPWNTIASHAALAMGLWIVVAGRGGRALAALTALAMACYWVRPADAACFAPLLVWAVLRLPTWPRRLLGGGAGMAAIAASVVAVGLLNREVFGTWDTPYDRISWDTVGFASYAWAMQTYWLLVDGGSFFGEADTALLFRHPWLVLALPGAWWWVRREGLHAAAALATMGLSAVLYFRYNDLLPNAVMRFSLIHYVSWLLMPLAGLAGFGLARAWRSRAGTGSLLAAAGLMVVATGLQLEPRPLPAATAPGRVEALPPIRPLWVHFPDLAVEQIAYLRLDGAYVAESSMFQRPYVDTDLRLILSERARGQVLAFTPEVSDAPIPRVGDFRWTWRWQPARWQAARTAWRFREE